MVSLTNMILIAALLMFICQLPNHTTEAVALRPTNCSLFKYVTGGLEAIQQYTAYMYNWRHSLETNNTEYSIATDLFEGLRVVAAAGVYSRMLESVQQNPLLQNYSGFSNHNIPGFFSAMFSNIIRDTCEWLLSYGDFLTLRQNINCSHPAEQIMLSHFAMIMPLYKDFTTFERGIGCGPHVRYNKWIQLNMLADFQPEVNYLEDLNNRPLTTPDSPINRRRRRRR